MCWLKRGMWKAGIAIAGMLLLLVLMVWIPVSAVGAYEGASGFATPGTGTVQATSTVDLTVTAVVQDQLKQQDDKLRRENSGLWSFWLTISGSIGTIFVAIAALLTAMNGFNQWLGNRRDEQQKRAEERFQAVVEGLGSERVEAKVGAAIMLRTFLQKDYEQFYSQAFDLAVAHLRLPRTSGQSVDDPDALHASPLSKDPDTPLSLTTLSQALIVVFKDAFPLARNRLKEQDSKTQIHPQSLDATSVQLDNAYLSGADLKQVWMPQASLRKANLRRADLTGAHLTGAHLSKADLRGAYLSGAYLSEADLRGADLRGAHLTGAHLSKADLSTAQLIAANLTGADLTGADLTGAYLDQADLRGAYLTGAHLIGADLSVVDFTNADLSEADFSEADLNWTKLENVLSLANAKLLRVKGLTKEQLEACKAKDATIDEDSTTSSSQPTASTSRPPQSSNAQAPSAPSGQESSPTPSTDGSSATSSNPASES